MNRCYEITKQGCEFLTHKTTGTKGNLFTHHYMERFEELENIALENGAININNIENSISKKINKEIDNLKIEYSSYIRPLAKDKVRLSKYIKDRLGITKANKDFYLVKERTLLLLDAEKWEDVPIKKLKEAFSIIDESIDVMIR